MGLRIIDRQPKSTPHLSEAERLALLDEQSRLWRRAHHRDDELFRKQFLETFKRVKRRLPASDELVAEAGRIRESIRREGHSGSQTHGRVDVATLLELL